MIRLAQRGDIPAIAEIYEAIHDREEQGLCTTGWLRGIYPTEQTALTALAAGDLYVLEENGIVRAAARINQEQVPEYVNAHWEHDAPANQVLVLHTLVVDPSCEGRGLAKQFVTFYEAEGLRRECPYLRMDTNARNTRARQLYAALGYSEAGIVDCQFNGIPGVHLVCLEKRIG